MKNYPAWAEKDMLKRKVGLLRPRLQDFNGLSDNVEKVAYLAADRLGLFSYSGLLLKNPNEGFVEELEIDVRGSMKIGLKSIYMELGEIKSGTGDYKKAIIQLLKRIGILYLAGLHSIPLSERDSYKFIAIGYIYTPLNWQQPDEALMEYCKQQAGIQQYPDEINIIIRSPLE